MEPEPPSNLGSGSLKMQSPTGFGSATLIQTISTSHSKTLRKCRIYIKVVFKHVAAGSYLPPGVLGPLQQVVHHHDQGAEQHQTCKEKTYKIILVSS